jgi:hypothetical protein
MGISLTEISLRVQKGRDFNVTPHTDIRGFPYVFLSKAPTVPSHIEQSKHIERASYLCMASMPTTG